MTDRVSLVDSLRAAGAGVEPAGKISQPFFSVDGRTVRVNGEDVQVFEYTDAAAASTEAALVSQDGDSVGTSTVSWVATPHFHRGRLIVPYVGDDIGVFEVLEDVVGPQFAGHSVWLGSLHNCASLYATARSPVIVGACGPGKSRGGMK